jgi:hypothetical protein
MRLRHLVAPLVAAGLLLLAACAQAPRGALVVRIGTDGPVAYEPSIVVSGPSAFQQTVTDDETLLSGLVPGTYTLTPVTAELPIAGHAGVDRFGASPRTVEVVANATAEEEVRFFYLGLTITDPLGDAEGTSATQPIFDAVELRADVDPDEVVLTLTLAEDQTDLEWLRGFVDIDADRNTATGQASGSTAFCSTHDGFEYVVIFDVAADEALLMDLDTTDMTPIGLVVDGNSVSLVIPLAELAGHDMFNPAAVIGNADEPTDCVPGGSPTL